MLRSGTEGRARGELLLPMTDRIYNVLFLCTGNSARSILAESILNRLGKGQFRGFSAGSHPNGQVNPFALGLLKRLDFPTEGLRSKSWDEFATPASPHFDFVITVCDNAAGETCPTWPASRRPRIGASPTRRPSKAQTSKRRGPLIEAFKSLETRIKLFLSLPIASLDNCASKRNGRPSEKRRRGVRPSECFRAISDGLGVSLYRHWNCLGTICYPSVFQLIGGLSIAQVNLPVGILIWVMIIPMLVKVDFGALGQIRRHVKGIGVTLFVNWLVKPFSMALLGWIFIRHSSRRSCRPINSTAISQG